MADTKISALSAGTTLAGTEEIPAVQSAATVKTTPAAIDTYISGTTKTLTNKTLTAPVLGGTVTGTYTIGGTPTFPATVVSTTGTQTLTNKTIAGANNTLTVREADLSIADNTTANASTSAHGFLKKLSNTATEFMNGAGDWAVPAGGSATPAGSDTQVQFNDGGAFGGDAGLVYNKTTDALSAAAAGSFGWIGRSKFLSSADGIITATNAAASGFTRLNLGGTSSSFPSLKNGSGNLHVTYADDSNFAHVFANSYYVVSNVYGGSNTTINWTSAAFTPGGTVDLTLSRSAAGILALAGASAGGAIEFTEMTAPSAPASNKARLFVEDDGAGKTRLMIQFPTGSKIQIAIEP